MINTRFLILILTMALEIMIVAVYLYQLIVGMVLMM
jgi:hypothetical protein